MTYDIRELVSDLLRDRNPIPTNPNREKKITSAIKELCRGGLILMSFRYSGCTGQIKD